MVTYFPSPFGNGQSHRTRAAPVNNTPVNIKDLLNSNRRKQQGTVVQSYSYISSSLSPSTLPASLFIVKVIIT